MFDLTPLLEAPTAVQIHAFAALEAVLLTPIVLFRKKRDMIHRISGYIWVTNMLIAAFSSFWIMEIQLVGPFSPIHALSLYVIFNVVNAVRHARRGNIRAHMGIMQGTALWGLGIAGAFTLLPGRRMNEVIFGPSIDDGVSLAVLASVVMTVGAAIYIVRRAPRAAT